MFRSLCIVILTGLFAASSCSPNNQPPAKPTLADSLVQTPLADIAAAIQNGDVTSEAIVEAYLKRISEIDRSGPTLNSIISLNPNALEAARQMDQERADGILQGPLHGVPILIKDNIETKDAMPTTAGSLALLNNQNGRDAPVVAGLRDAGAIILGKSNLSQWANFRSTDSISGWSAVGGQVRNPHILDRSPCGSSSGSAAAAAAFLAAGTVGTETNGSIICPSVMNGIVGFKPTVGLVSRTHIIPISPTQDTAGPMTRTVQDAAIMLTAMAGTDPADDATAMADSMKRDYAADLDNVSIDGNRVGVMRFAEGDVPKISVLFQNALGVLEDNGAILVEIDAFDPPENLWGNEFLVLKAEFKDSLNRYLASTKTNISTRNLTQLIEFNEERADIELVLFSQDIFSASDELPGLDDADYQAALATILSGTRENGIDKLLADFEVDVLVAPTARPAFLIDQVHGDSYPGGVGTGWLPAIAGYPHLTVPMGEVRGLPVGISFMSTAWKDSEVLQAGYVYEQNSNMMAAPEFMRSVSEVPRIQEAMAPARIEP